MKYCYLLFLYKPKHKYDGYIYEGHYEDIPMVFKTLKDARKYKRKYKHASFIKKVGLH